MIFRQLSDPETSTYTYLIADRRSREAVLIDTVREQFDRDRTLLHELDLTLCYTLETHVHADHVTASGRFRQELGSKVVVGAACGVENADIALQDDDRICFGRHVLVAWPTPGHTSGCITYVCRDESMAFTGDAILIRGCGRSDFQDGNAATLFASVRKRVFSLPDETLLYPGHDYKGRTVTTVGEEKQFNPRLGLGKSEAEFVALMNQLNLAYPKQIDIAVPANLESGLVASLDSGWMEQRDSVVTGSVATVMESQGRQDAEMWMGMGI